VLLSSPLITYQPHPLIPLSFKGEGEYFIKRGFASLKLSLFPEILREFRGGFASSPL